MIALNMNGKIKTDMQLIMNVCIIILSVVILDFQMFPFFCSCKRDAWCFVPGNGIVIQSTSARRMSLDGMHLNMSLTSRCKVMTLVNKLCATHMPLLTMFVRGRSEQEMLLDK